MSMNTLPQVSRFSTMTKNARKVVVDNSPAILTAISVAGVVATTVLAVKATPAAHRDIQEAKSERTEPVTPVDQVKLTWQYYIPTATMASATIACIIGANTISTKRQAALISAYTLSEKAIKEYKEKVVQTIGENKEQKIRDEVAQDRVKNNPVTDKQVIVTGNGDVLCYDDLTGRYFEGNVESIRKAQNDVNAQILNEMYVSQNEFYERIGLPSTRVGEEFGWTQDNMMDIHFSTVMSADGKPCISINYRFQPVRDYYKFG